MTDRAATFLLAGVLILALGLSSCGRRSDLELPPAFTADLR
jgi:predicted small lipoprotein YifL